MNEPVESSATSNRPVRVWDLPTRAFHWLLAVDVSSQIVTAKLGGNAMDWHFRVGYCVFALLGFRLVWGFVGGRWSRFSSFIPGPATVLRYLRGDHRPGDHFDVGHNPLGACSVVAMLVLLAVQVASGLVADDEIAHVGPFNAWVSSALAGTATAWHKGPGQALLIALVVLHVGAIVYHRLRKGRNLVQSMIGGDKTLRSDVPASACARWR